MTAEPRTVPAQDEGRMNAAPLRKLRELRDPTGGLLSVYLTVPPDPTALRELPAQLDRLLATARPQPATQIPTRRMRAARVAVRQLGLARARDWFGRTTAVVASGDGDVLHEIKLPATVPDRAVFGRRPYLRPLLRANQAARPYLVVVLDRRQAWLFEVDGSAIQRVRLLEGESIRGHTHAGWYGLEEHRIRHHKAEQANRHYQATAAAVEERAPAGRPLVVGGHKDGVSEFLATLPAPLAARVAGTFVVDPHTMTPHVVHGSAAAVMARWEAERQERIAADLARWEAARLAVTGVERSAEMVSTSMADLLVVRGDEPVPGVVCGSCGTITTRRHRCTVTPPYPVPDVIDEMILRMLDTGGKIDLGGQEQAGLSVAVRLHHATVSSVELIDGVEAAGAR
ncbi:MAG TPA: hypothetical protein VFZ63_19255 [Jiangellaceae bacterium]